jgi:hypothetical protein
MVAFWRMDSLSSPVTIPDSCQYSGAVRNLLQGTTSVCLATTGLFGSLPSGALTFDNDYYSATSTAYDDTPVTQNEFTVAFWYDFSSSTTGATVGIIEYASQSTSTANIRQHLGIALNTSSRSFVYTYRTGATDTVASETPVGVADNGHLALSVTSAVSGTATATWYYNGSLLKASGFSDTRSSVTSTASARWGIAGTRGGGATPGNRAIVTLDEMAVWAKSLKAEKIRELYASCVRPWDQQTLEDTNSHRTFARVLIEDSTGNMVDVTNLCGINWLLSADVSEEVDNPAIQAAVVLTRKTGKLLDLSPLNEPAYRAVLNDDVTTAQLIDFRRRIVIERAFVPQLYAPQGWEWELRFDGFIDAWDVSEDQVRLVCVDKAAPLIDQFIMDQKSYAFYQNNKSMEEHLQQIINDNIPKIPTASGNVFINYKGGNPQIYTEAGTAASNWLNNAGWNLRYNDVASGTVLSALQAVTDQIGYLVGYRFNEPGHEYRLETNYPKRNKSFYIKAVAPVSSGIEVTTYEPHGFNVGSIASIYGTSSLNFGGSVASVIDFYRIRFDGYTGGSTATETTGSLVFQQHLALTAQDIFSVDPVKSEIANIRNHAIVKYQRVDSLASVPVFSVTTSAASGNVVFVALPSSAIDLSSIDPDNQGITFTVANCTGSASNLNGNYTGTILSKSLVRSNEVYGPGGTITGLDGNFSCPYVSFQQVTSTATESVSKYGLRPVGMYEGSGLAISTSVEANRIADSFMSDLAEPTVDMSMRTRVLDLQLGDLVALPNDPKGRWVKSTGALIPAIVGIKEHYESDKCYADYDLRHTRPTAGTKIYDRLRGSWGIYPGVVNKFDVVEELKSLRLQSGMGRTFSMGFPRNQRREMSLRDDKVEFHISTSSGFRPGPDTLVYRGRSDHMSISQDGAGNALTPGTTYYMRMRHVDIYGNPSQITGLNAASASSVPSIYVRYLDQRPECMVAETTAVTNNLIASTFTPWPLTYKDGGDAAGISFDNFNNFTVSSRMWRAPATGHYSITHRSYWLGDGAKPLDGHTVVGGVQHISSGTVVGEYSLTLASSALWSTLALLSVNAQVFCQSGDFLRVCVAQSYRGIGTNTGNRAFILPTTTATFTYPFTTFSMLSES